jgi:hypothetical protein
VFAGCSHAVAVRPAVRAGFLGDTTPPLVAGIRLGDSAARVRAVLGTPTTEERLMADARQLAYRAHGIVVVTTGDQGVAMIGLLAPNAPQLNGVRVGDPVSYLIQRWGPPDQRGAGRVSYKVGRWGALVVVDTLGEPERVESITFGWASPKQSRLTPPWPAAAQP